ncbi:hypothetical protein RED65_13997 [Oceanobacter sp. RED65]|uniref:Uncharacterized protein n=1 Tax=Bermanella marisrubri TaxID=207949 RepID=Q1N0Z5_9GAMM|nr:hypothetical protein RED65_13997 [Oceanobacter sp. RED65] [Bermanella marisrubri]
MKFACREGWLEEIKPIALNTTTFKAISAQSNQLQSPIVFIMWATDMLRGIFYFCSGPEIAGDPCFVIFISTQI